MTIELMPARPPFVRFEQRPVEDRAATLESGGMVYKDVDYAIIMQPGSKDTYEPEAIEWLKEIGRQAHQGNYPQAWVDHFQRTYDAWKKGQEAPLNGLSVRQWPSCTPAMVETFISHKLLCVEDVAAMSEDTMRKLGPGSREWKTKAAAFISNKDRNRSAEQVAALQAEISNRDVRIQSLEARLARLEAGAGMGENTTTVPADGPGDEDDDAEEATPAARRRKRA